ncbi:ecdysteroid 22-kinase family protein [Halosquirtibacter xylanolyticus]|uniref:oxidoreductase family protein n=1 Tax=Halosquirtibacter xylanolyticus TaxID=3374599 RepID=UPI003749CECA|nr:ecdysteroid 22-kinase family protein [Prolixibacteraceae bacterium]
MMENKRMLELVRDAVGATSISQKEVIQQLWSGYGTLSRCTIEGKEFEHVIVKHIKTASMNHHPRGWNTSLSHERKVKSYQVEIAWYQQFADQCDDHCRVPHCLAVVEDSGDQIIVMEDLDDAGFPIRKYDLSMDEIFTTLRWLAFFHAKHMHVVPDNLWNIGTYWHLDTRPEELEVMSDKVLKHAASAIDHKLNHAKYLTLVHGDAKVANFCYAPDGNSVAGVDFQYIGAGCGMKDVAYFVSSCLYESDCERYESLLLDHYFTYLKEALDHYQSTTPFEEIEKEWRALYMYAWTDFYRFLQGWSPDHWKINGYNQKIAREVIKQLKKDS